MQRQVLSLILAVLAIGSFARAATVSFSLEVTDPNSMYLMNLGKADLDRDNVGGDGATDGPGNDGTTYVAGDRPAQGQTFTTGSIDAVLTAVWVQHVGYNGNNADGGGNTWYAMPANSTLTLRITDPSAADTDDFVLLSETATIIGDEENVLPPGVTNTEDGTGTFVRIALEEPFVLAANTEYGFDLGAASAFFELSGISDDADGGNPYADGTAYTSGGSGVGDNSMATAAGDHVFILETGIYTSPALNPQPVEGAVDVSFEDYVTFSWDAGMKSTEDLSGVETNPEIMYHYLYVSAANDSSFDGISGIMIDADSDPADGVVDPSVSYTLDTLLNSDSTYYWRVDEVLDDGTGTARTPLDPNNIFGDVWTFATAKQQAQLDADYPLDNAVEEGDEITLTVAATNPITGDQTGMSYQWYTGQGTIVDGETAAELALAITAADYDSTYYCSVTVDVSGLSIDSRTSTISEKAMVAYWPLDSDLIDATGNGNDGIMTGVESYAAATVANGLNFDGAADYVDLPDGFDNMKSGLTITLWANPSAAGSYARFIEFGNAPYSDNIFLGRVGTGSTMIFHVYQGGADAGSVSADGLELNTWQFLAVTMDNMGNTALYKDGIKLAEGQIGTPDIITRTGNFIGASNWEADALYQGMLDDIKFYNYAKSDTEIAEDYYQINGEFCLEYPAYDLTGIDGTPDCLVDVLDLALIANQWLDCGMFPECP